MQKGRKQSILVYREQGLGDTIQYARYAPLVARGGARVVLACAPRLVGLLRRLPDVGRVAPADRPPPPTDWHCSLLDVPMVLGHDVDSIPAACPYLPPVRRERPVLSPARQFRVAIVWAGNPRQDRDWLRSCRLEDFALLFEQPGTEFVSFHPTMRLFRQPAPDDWAGMFREVRRELAARVAGSLQGAHGAPRRARRGVAGSLPADAGGSARSPV